jgi:glycosyltransferase involved in cell wall biosynthesis
MEKIIPLFYRGVPFVAVSESTKAELVKMGLRDEDIEIIHNGVDHDAYTPDESMRSAAPLVVCVTRLKKYKGVHLLLQAMEDVKREIPGVKLVVAGRGDYEPKLHELTHRLNLNGCVEFAGFLGTSQKVDLYRRAHVVVNPSAKEGWGLTVVEANACGTPVVAAEVPGLKESVIRGETGLLYPHSDIKALSTSILSLLKDERLRNRFGARSLELAKEFTWQKATDSIEAFMEQVVHGWGGAKS